MDNYLVKNVSSIKPFFYFLLKKDFKELAESKWSVIHSKVFTLSDEMINGKNVIEYVVDTQPSFNPRSSYSEFKGEFLLTYKESANECLNCFIENISNLYICEKSVFCYKGKNYLIHDAKISNLVPIEEQDGYVVYQGKYQIKICELIARKE